MTVVVMVVNMVCLMRLRKRGMVEKVVYVEAMHVRCSGGQMGCEEGKC